MEQTRCILICYLHSTTRFRVWWMAKCSIKRYHASDLTGSIPSRSTSVTHRYIAPQVKLKTDSSSGDSAEIARGSGGPPPLSLGEVCYHRGNYMLCRHASRVSTVGNGIDKVMDSVVPTTVTRVSMYLCKLASYTRFQMHLQVNHAGSSYNFTLFHVLLRIWLHI